MTKKCPYKVEPISYKLFYTYLLLKPNNEIFYVGKGKGDRINHHFKPYMLNSNSIKSNIINKYGKEFIKRQIVTYHVTEEEAYETEEFLIKCYGVKAEGGILANVSKTRYDYPENVKGFIAENKVKSPQKYTEDQILSCYQLYYKELKTVPEVSSLTGIPANYLYYILDGTKCKNLFKREGVADLKENHKKVKSLPEPLKYSDESMIKAIKLYYESNLHIEDIVESLGLPDIPLTYIRAVVQGNKRKYLFDNYKESNPDCKRIVVKDGARIKNKVLALIKQGKSYTEVNKLIGVPSTTFYRWRNELPSGTGDSTGNNSATNSDNKA